jgi:hypothetical protein
MTIKRYLPDGSVRQVVDQATTYRHKNEMPARASRVEVIENGDCAGKFSVDFEPLFKITGRTEHYFCLPVVFDSYHEAVSAEVDWLVTHYVLEATCENVSDTKRFSNSKDLSLKESLPL